MFDLYKNRPSKGRLYSHALISAILIMGITFGSGGKKVDSGKKASPRHSITWNYDAYKIRSNAVLTIALANTIGSGKTQILTGCYQTGSLDLYEKSGKGLTYLRRIGTTKGGITDMKLLSMDGAQNKAVVSHEGKGSLQIFDLRGDSKPLSLFHGPHAINTVAIADFNGDGLGDILPISYEGRTETWFQNEGNQGFVKKKLPVLSRKVTAIKVGDFDKDGDQDILLASDYSKMIKLLLNDGQGNFERQVITKGIRGVLDIEMLDMNMDGKMDIAYASYQQKRVQLLLNSGDGFEIKNVSTRLRSLNNIEVFDLGKDGRPDLIISSFEDDAIRVIENAANGLREHQFQTSIPAPTDIAVKTDAMTLKTTLYVSSMTKNKVYEIDLDIED